MAMVMDTKAIDLTKYRGHRSTVFTGRPQGEDARRELQLNDLDRGDQPVRIIIPTGTTSFNSSFYLGLLYDSIKHLGEDGFKQKYILEVKDPNHDTQRSIRRNLEDGLRQALNAMRGKSNSWLFK